MNDNHRIVELRIDPSGRGSIVVDGVDLSLLVNSVDVRSRVGDTTSMTVSLVAPRVDFQGAATVEVVGETRDTLIALGWIPPSEDTARPATHMTSRWRQGTRVPNHVYLQRNDQPDRRPWPDGDPPIATFLDPLEAELACRAVNAYLATWLPRETTQ